MTRIAILLTDSFTEDRERGLPDDGERIRDWLLRARPDWDVAVFEMPNGQWPDGAWDGVVISGSPSSVHDDKAWIGELKAEVRRLVAAEVPLLGICFGHQAIAAALGGAVTEVGWILGSATFPLLQGRDWMADLPSQFRCYASNKEQVTTLPPGAVTLGGDARCQNALVEFAPLCIGIQYHPEFPRDYAALMIEDQAAVLGELRTEGFRRTLPAGTDGPRLAAAFAQLVDETPVAAARERLASRR